MRRMSCESGEMSVERGTEEVAVGGTSARFGGIDRPPKDSMSFSGKTTDRRCASGRGLDHQGGEEALQLAPRRGIQRRADGV